MLAIASPLVGLAALAWLPWMIGALARLDIAVAHAMLGPTEGDRLGVRVSELASSRSRMSTPPNRSAAVLNVTSTMAPASSWCPWR